MKTIVEEKLEVASSSDTLKEWHKIKLEKIRSQKTIDFLSLHFKKIETEEIDRMLNNGKIVFTGFGEIDKHMFIASIMFLSFITIGAICYSGGSILSTMMSSILGLFFFSGLVISLNCFKRINVKWKRLSNWKEDLPYGAILAVKEAEALDMKHFRIYFPSLVQPKSDPIITAFCNDSEHLIFAWNLEDLINEELNND